MASPKKRDQLDGEIIRVRRGVAIYKRHCSPYYQVRVLKSDGKYAVRSTKETSRIEARKVAEELALSILKLPSAVPSNLTFNFYARRFIDEAKNYVASGMKSQGYDRNAHYFINNEHWGLRDFFGLKDVTNISSADFTAFMRKVIGTKPDMSKSIIGALTATFRNVMKGALDDGVIPFVPVTPKPKTKAQVPRPFFRFHPLVSKTEDQYDRICKAIKECVKNGTVVRGTPITHEFYDLVLFLTNSFLRPTYSELYALKHSDVAITNENTENKNTSLKTLRLNVRKGKTGSRHVSTMPTCVSVYERICARKPNRNADDYLFFNDYPNRDHAMRVAQNQLNFALKNAGLERDPYTNQKHTMYSFRHTAICMRLVLSKGEVNIFTLAKNAGTSVEIIENFYAKKLPLSDDLVRNLQTFGR